MANIKSQLEQIEKEKEQLILKQKQLEQEANYYKKIEARDQYFERESKNIIDRNKRIINFYDELISYGVKENVKLVEKTINIKLPNYYLEELKEEDKPDPLEIISCCIEIVGFGKYTESIFYVENNKVQFYRLIGSYRNVTAKTLASKIKEKLEQKEQRIKEGNKREEVKQTLTKYFKEKYPDVDVSYDTKWESGFKRNEGHYLYFIILNFPNKSWVRIKYYNDGTWSISESYDSKKPSTKEELLDYLSKGA